MEQHFSSTYELSPDTSYTTGNGAQYTTDGNGSISTFSSDLSQDKAERVPSHQQNLSGKQQGEHAGHLIAASQGGSGKVDNLVRMDAHVNQVDYRAFERENDNLMKDGKEVHLDGSLANNADGKPDAIMVSRSVSDPITGKTEVDHNSCTNTDMREFENDNSWVELADTYENPGAITVDDEGNIIGSTSEGTESVTTSESAGVDTEGETAGIDAEGSALSEASCENDFELDE